jgi:opacity protein-like surface antigen/ribosomal protein L12E/L44/L45/RPP1/RPP2
MKKSVGIIILISLLIFFEVASASQNQKLRVRVVSEQANIRVKPDISSEMLLQVPEGTEFEVEKKEGEWFQVLVEKADGTKIRGYVHESLVEVVSGGKPQTAISELKKPGSSKKEETTKVQSKEESKPEITVPSNFSQASMTRPLRNFSLNIHSLGIYLSPSQLNQAAEGVTNYYLYVFESGGKAKLSPLHIGFGYGADIFYEFWPSLSLGLGFDYFQSSKVNLTEFTGGNVNYSVKTTVGVKDLPLRVSLKYKPVEHFYIGFGLEYNLARMNYDYLISQQVGSSAESWASWRGTARGHSLGWIESAGLQWPVTSWFQVFAEASYRSVRIKNFAGNNLYTDSDGWQKKEVGDLYYWQVQTSPNISYPVLFIRDHLPSEPGVVNPRKADLNYSGFSLKLGLRFVF